MEDWGNRGEQAGTWAGLSKEGVERTSEACGGAIRIGQVHGHGACSHHHFPYLHLTGGKFGQCYCLVWSLNGDPPPRFPRERWGLQPSESPASWLPRPLAAALGRPGCQTARVVSDVTRVRAWPCPVLGLVRRGARKESPSLLCSFAVSFFPYILRSFRSFHF